MPRNCMTNSSKRVIPLSLTSGTNIESILSHLQPNTVVHMKLTLLLKNMDKNNAYSSEFIVNSDARGMLSIVGNKSGIDNTGIMYLHEDNENYDFKIVVSESGKEVQAVVAIVINDETSLKDLIGILFSEEMRVCYM